MREDHDSPTVKREHATYRFNEDLRSFKETFGVFLSTLEKKIADKEDITYDEVWEHMKAPTTMIVAQFPPDYAGATEATTAQKYLGRILAPMAELSSAIAGRHDKSSHAQHVSKIREAYDALKALDLGNVTVLAPRTESKTDEEDPDDDPDGDGGGYNPYEGNWQAGDWNTTKKD